MGNTTSHRVNSTSPQVNSTSHRVNSPSSTGLDFSISVIAGYLTGFFKQKYSTFVPKHPPPAPAGLTVIFHDETNPNPNFNSNSDYIVFPSPPLTAVQLLYSAPGELWNWSYPKPKDFPATHAIAARDGMVVPTRPNDVIRSEEYTCIVSVKDGVPKMTHMYGDTVIDCHPLPPSMVEAAGGGGELGELSDDQFSDEVLKNCYICRNIIKQMSDINMHKDETFYSNKSINGDVKANDEVEENKN